MKTELRVKRVSINDKQLQSKWKEWEKDTNTSPFLYYDYTRFIYRYYKYYSIGYTPAIYCVTDGSGNILMILPLKKRLFGGYLLLNDIQGCGATGCIHDPKGVERIDGFACPGGDLRAVGKGRNDVHA